MKTDDLIKALAADTATPVAPISRTISVAVAAGAITAAAIFAATLGMRADFGYVFMNSWQFVLKFIFTLGVAIPAFLLVQKLARPDGDGSSIVPILVVPVIVLLAAIGFEFVQNPSGTVSDVIFAPNWLKCFALIPLLSMTPLAAVLYALKQGAPANPALAGGVGGLLSAAMGATLYASHCNADSPMFVGVWYPLGIAIIVAVGALIGSRLLRW